jgi:hypothetical protein
VSGRTTAPTPVQAPEVVTLRIAGIIIDEAYQVRMKTDAGTVLRYFDSYRNEVQLPPVEVAQVSEARILVDGFHRVAALKRLGRHEVDAVVKPADTVEEARWMAAKANLSHGLALKAKEHREVFRAYVHARKHLDDKGGLKSYRDIARDLGGVRAYTTIRGWMQKDFRHIARRMGGDARFIGTGGLQGNGRYFTQAAGDHLDNFLAACRGVKDPHVRGEYITRMEDALDEMRRMGYERPDF